MMASGGGLVRLRSVAGSHPCTGCLSLRCKVRLAVYASELCWRIGSQFEQIFFNLTEQLVVRHPPLWATVLLSIGKAMQQGINCGGASFFPCRKLRFGIFDEANFIDNFP